MKVIYKCIFCGKTVFRYASTVRNPCKVFCDRTCYGKFNKIAFRGKDNPNYKKGTTCLPSYCQCGKLKDSRSKQCALCAKVGHPVDYIPLSKEEILNAVKASKSFLDCAKKLGKQRYLLTKRIRELGIDTSHFSPGRGRQIPDEKLFSKGQRKRNGTLKKRILESDLLKYICGLCGQLPSHNKESLVLELDHINGDSTDNRLKNLRFLCPNCHSQQPTSKGSNYKCRK